jgi:hypothetical protein
MLAVHEGLTRARVMAVIEELGAKGATGVLEVRGEPSGVMYLDGGHLAFAGASWVPGLVDRLRGLRPSSAELQQVLAGWGADDAAIATLALQRGYLSPPALHELIRSIVVDVFLVLVVPLPENSYVADIQFTSARARANAVFPQLDVDSVGREAMSRADRMAKYGLAPTTSVALRDLRRPAAVLTREQWAAASQISGNASARELALRHGTALADMTECLGSLARAGLCAPVRVPRRGLPAAVPPGQRPGAHDARPAPDYHGSAPAVQAVQRAREPQPPQPVRREQAPTADVLRQVLNGLRNLA